MSSYLRTVVTGISPITHCSAEMQSHYHTAALLLEGERAAFTEKPPEYCFSPLHCKTNTALDRNRSQIAALSGTLMLKWHKNSGDK